MPLHHPYQEEEESGSDEDVGTATARQTFEDEHGVAIGFFIHESVKKLDQRNKLMQDIQNNGGIVLDNFDLVDTVIFNDNDLVNPIDPEILRMKYNCRPGRSQADPIYVEPMTFVQRCLREGVVRHRLPLRKGMGGKVGPGRTPFTKEDDDHLCYYISRRIPDKNNGGRTGNNLFIFLEKLGNADRDYAWARRHSWHSWRTRYKNNAERFDYVIDHYAEIDPPSEHVQYHLRRGWSSRYQRLIRTHVDYDEELDTDEQSDAEEELDLDDREEDDATVHPETVPFRTKRQRPSGRNSPPSASPAKRRRTDTYAQETRRHVLQTRSKGKTRAVSPLDDPDDAFNQHNIDEPYPFDTRFESTNLEEPGAGPSFGSLTIPQTSQMTLVGTNPPTMQHSPTSEMSPMPHVSTEMSRAPIEKIGHEDGTPEISNVHVSPPPTQRSWQTTEQEEQRPAPLVEDKVEASSVVSPAPAPRPLTAKKRARHPKVAPVIAQTEAPYRNTRSRSRSVEPSVIPAQPAVSKARNKRKQDQSQLEPLHESVQEEERAELIMPETALISGTLDEERDVENLLVTTSHISAASGIPDVVVNEMATSGTPSPRSKSRVLDSDDEQTRHDLRDASRQPSLQYSKWAGLDPTEVLRSFTANLPIASRSRQSTVRPLRPLPTRSRRQGTSIASSFDRRIVESTPQAQTPRRLSQTRAKSTSSTESFPVPGTRARDTKKKYEEVEKSSPYKPPAGTRAAQYLTR